MTRDSEYIPSIAVAKFSGSFNRISPEEANEIFIKLLSEISIECGNKGCSMIGHNKANFKCGDDFLSISCTTEDGNVRSKTLFREDVTDYIGVMNIIVYGLEYVTLREIIESKSSAIDGCKVVVLKDKGCDDPECTDPNCTDEKHRRIINIEGL
ncbi:MAG: hypothetical protein IJF47_02830 [Candidatus Methanomethylophilaceae archaeon]|mgnify:CR=1 FL=1|nr:hypothetical protein [Candidatus Methanomethylophilaceae archaeon]